MTNWVDRRVKKEEVLQKNAPAVWNSLSKSLHGACESFRKYYSTSGIAVQDQPSKGSREIVIVDTQRDNQRTDILVSFNPTVLSIQWKAGNQTGNCKISSDENDAFLLCDGERLDPDELARRILEPALFP